MLYVCSSKCGAFSIIRTKLYIYQRYAALIHQEDATCWKGISFVEIGHTQQIREPPSPVAVLARRSTVTVVGSVDITLEQRVSPLHDAPSSWRLIARSSAPASLAHCDAAAAPLCPGMYNKCSVCAGGMRNRRRGLRSCWLKPSEEDAEAGRPRNSRPRRHRARAVLSFWRQLPIEPHRRKGRRRRQWITASTSAALPCTQRFRLNRIVVRVLA